MESLKQSFGKVLTIQEPVSPLIEEEKATPIKLRTLLAEKGILEQLGISEVEFGKMYAVLVNASAVNSLDTYVDENAQVVVLPRLVGG